MFLSQFTIAALVLAFAYIANAHTVVDIAKYHSPVGHHGPALVNSHGGYGGGYGGGYDGGYGGGYNGGYGHGWDVGHPHGAPHITLVFFWKILQIHSESNSLLFAAHIWLGLWR